ncbi:hypothetical protein BA177_02870 [Woeseia oceani]|uniref:DUF6265 domain-containing protein n=1 Tax=Woeseia oceani TaxID=1548547 RepID=A0A193LKH9_9GAMM|nr:hypothetical protein BA177_02870 [Woeseia oceani]
MLLLTSLPVQAADINTLNWLAGCWQHDNAEAGNVEVWTRPAGGTMLGASRTVRDGQTVAWEYLRIEADERGQLSYIASPSGQTTTRFRMARLATHDVVFENLQHDFPQRIRYRQLASGQLLASIEGESKGQNRLIEFLLSRCE